MKSRPPSTARERGASLVEFGLLAGLIAVVSIGAVQGAGLEVAEVYCRASSSLDRAMGGEGYGCEEYSDVAIAPGAGSGNSGSGGSELDPGRDTDWSEAETPDAFDFEDYFGAEPSTMMTSSPITLTGFSGTIPAFTSNNGFFSINGGPFTSESEVSAGDAIRLRRESHPDYSENSVVIFRAGGAQDVWYIRTHGGDQTPDNFAFTDVTGVAPYSTEYSEPFRLSGVDQPISATGSNYAWWQILDEERNAWNGVGYNALVHPGSVLRLKAFAPYKLDDTRTVTATLGERTAAWSITTQENYDMPAFAFTDVTGVEGTDTIYSNEVVMSGLSTPARVTFPSSSTAHSSGFALLINDLPHPASGDDTYWVENGDRLQLSTNFHRDDAFDRTVRLGVEISGTTDHWSVSTGDGMKSVAMADFVDLTDVEMHGWSEQTRTVSGFDGIAKVSTQQSGLEIYVNGTRNDAAAIRDGDTLTFRGKSSSRPSTAQVYTIELGDRTLDWSIETEAQVLPDAHGIESAYAGEVDSYVKAYFTLSGSNYTSYVNIDTDVSTTGLVRGGSGSDNKTFYTTNTDGYVMVRVPEGGTTATMTISDTADPADATMTKVYTFQVNPQ